MFFIFLFAYCRNKTVQDYFYSLLIPICQEIAQLTPSTWKKDQIPSTAVENAHETESYIRRIFDVLSDPTNMCNFPIEFRLVLHDLAEHLPPKMPLRITGFFFPQSC